MRELVFSPDFIKKLKTLRRRNPSLVRKIETQLIRFQANSRHPSLRLHKLKGNLNQVWSLSVTTSFRLVFQKNEREDYFFDLGEHDEIYQ